MIKNTKDCFARHMGLFMCEHTAAQFTIAMVKNGLAPMKSAAAFEDAKTSIDRGFYQIEDGIAIIKVCGIMQKQESKFDGFCSTVKARASISMADSDPMVKGLFLYFDTPGGFSAGTHELAEAIAGCEKPIRGYAADSCFSAGYYAASRCDYLSMNAPGSVGSIGTYGVLEDTSKAYEMDGVRAILVTTGSLKGQGVDGVPITDEAVKEYQSQVDRMNSFFMQSISAGRKMPMEKVKELATGAIWGSADALSLGLVDAVESLDSALNNFADYLDNEDKQTTQTGAFKMSEENKELKSAEAPAAAAPAVAAPEVKAETPEFIALADKHGYEFAKANFGKPENEILSAVIADKDSRLSAADEKIKSLEQENAELKAKVIAPPSAGSPAIPFKAAETEKKKVSMYDANGKLNRSK